MGHPMASQSAFLAEGWRPLATLLFASVVVMGSPGPSTMSATAMGAAFGLRRSLNYVGGLIAGTIVVLLAVAIGVVALVLSIPQSANALSAIAAVYILYLAYKIATAPPLESARGHIEPPAFAGGFLLAIANPKAYLAIAAVYAGASGGAANRNLDAIVKIALLCAMIVVIHLFWLFAGASLSHLLRDPVRSRLVNIALAAALIATTLAGLLK
jgi:threonine/homoserine/homoserine lactone efflux protein